MTRSEARRFNSRGFRPHVCNAVTKPQIPWDVPVRHTLVGEVCFDLLHAELLWHLVRSVPCLAPQVCPIGFGVATPHPAIAYAVDHLKVVDANGERANGYT